MLGVRMAAGHCGKQREEKHKTPEALSGCVEQASNQAGCAGHSGAPAGAAGPGEQSWFLALCSADTPELRGHV